MVTRGRASLNCRGEFNVHYRAAMEICVHPFFLALLTATWCCCCQQEARVCNDESAATHSDADPMATYPRASDKSTRLVGELLSPFSLQDFAEKHWERMPLIIRGRCVIFDIDAVLQNSGTLVLYY